MEHDPEVIRICVVKYLNEVRRCKNYIKWTRKELADAEENMDALQGMSFGCEPTIHEYREKTYDAFILLSNAREKCAKAISENMGFISEASRICDKNDTDLWAVWLRWVDGCSWSEIGQLTGYSISTLKTHIAPRAYRKIYKRIPLEFRSDSFPNAED